MKRTLLCVTLFAMLFTLVGCQVQQTPPTQQAAGEPVTVVVRDDMDRDITITGTPLRIISLAPSNTEMLYALGLGDKVVGVTEYCNYPIEALAVEKMGDFANPSLEKILSLEPDLVLAASLHKTVVEQLDELNIPTLVMDALSISQVFNNIDMLVKATGAETIGQQVRETMQKTLDDVKARVESLTAEQRIPVYYEVWGDPIMTAGPGTFVHELIELAGGTNIAGNSSEKYPVYSLEEVLAQRPQFMFYGHAIESVEHIIANRPDWSSIPAFVNGQVFLIDEDHILRPTPRLMDGLLAISQHLHPDLWK